MTPYASQVCRCARHSRCCYCSGVRVASYRPYDGGISSLMVRVTPAGGVEDAAMVATRLSVTHDVYLFISIRAGSLSRSARRGQGSLPLLGDGVGERHGNGERARSPRSVETCRWRGRRTAPGSMPEPGRIPVVTAKQHGVADGSTVVIDRYSGKLDPPTRRISLPSGEYVGRLRCAW